MNYALFESLLKFIKIYYYENSTKIKLDALKYREIKTSINSVNFKIY